MQQVWLFMLNLLKLKVVTKFCMWSRKKVYVCAKNVLGATKALRLGAKRTVLSGFASTKRLNAIA